MARFVPFALPSDTNLAAYLDRISRPPATLKAEMEHGRKLLERSASNANKKSGTKHARYPIGTWKMPYGVNSHYKAATQRGGVVAGTGVPSDAAK